MLSALVVRASQAAPLREPSDLSWLRTQGNRIVDDLCTPVYLRGVTVVGADQASPAPHRSLTTALGLDDRGLDILNLWGINLIRLPLNAESVLTGMAVADFLVELDNLVDRASSQGAYVMLAPRLAPPSATTMIRCCQLLANHYQHEPAILYEPQTPSASAARWQRETGILVGSIRAQNPASLIVVSGPDDVAIQNLPLRFSTGAPVHNIVYTLAAAPDRWPHVVDPVLNAFASAYPLFAHWSDSGADFGRTSDAASGYFERFGISWAASAWNTPGTLVSDVAAHRFGESRFGFIVRRALALPTPLHLTPYPVV